MLRQIYIAIFVAALALGSTFGHAQDKRERNLAMSQVAQASEQRVALVIGNSAYKESPLANPVNDATDMAAVLQQAGFKVIRRLNANTRDMRQAVREFGNELRRAQVGLFYFAGHGVQIRGNNYLMPVGADIQGEADVEDLAIDANLVMRTMEEAQVKVSIAILDACRNNPFARSFRSASRGLAQMSAATGSLVAFATAPGSVAADGSGRNGVYTKHLLSNLKESDTDILKVFQRTRAGVVRETGGKQTPWESTSLIGDFFFRPPAGGAQVASIAPVASSTPAASNTAANDRTLWEMVKESKSPSDFEAYLEQFPQGLFSGLARSRLKALQGTHVANVAPTSVATPANTSANDRVFWESVKDSRDPANLRAYLSRFPNGLFVEIANNRIQTISEEEWKRLKDTRDSAELRAFLSRFPTGEFAELANGRLQALAQNSDLVGPWVLTNVCSWGSSQESIQIRSAPDGQIAVTGSGFKSGTVDNRNITLSWETWANSAIYSGRITGNKMEGTYNQARSGETCRWHAVKV